MCNGGCPKDRIIKTPDGEEGLNYLCAGLKQFFTHSKPYFRKFAELVEAGEPTEKLMEIVRAADAKTSVPSSRSQRSLPLRQRQEIQAMLLGKANVRR